MNASTLTKRDVISMINHIILFFKTLSYEWQEKFLDSLNKNPLRFVVRMDRITTASIYNFNTWENYFAFYNPNNTKKITLINKGDVVKVYENIKKVVINNMLTNHNFKLN